MRSACGHIQAGWKKAAEAGIMYVKIQWKQILRRNYMARERYLLSPHDRSYDVHVNVPGGTLVSVSQWKIHLNAPWGLMV
jgi:hypothetical protein